MNTTIAGPSPWKGRQILIFAFVIELCLGCGYGWSLFVKPFMARHPDWTQAQVTLAFSLAFFFNGMSYLVSGYWADLRPRAMMMVGGVCFGLGVIVAGLGGHLGYRLPLYAGYGMVGGFSIGLCYLSALSVAMKWFPRRPGLVSGIVVMGCGMGPVLVGLLVPGFIDRFGPGLTFMGMGVVFLIVCTTLGPAFRNPPTFESRLPQVARPSLIPWDILRQGKFWGLWAMLFVSICAGIGVISQAAPMAQELHGLSLLAAGRLVAVMAVFNGLGRLFWSTLSERIGRPRTILTIYASLAFVFAILVHIGSVWLFQAACCYVTFCFGGGFGTMPAFTADLFGIDKVGRIYGPILSAQAAAGLIGPLLYAYLREWTGNYTLATYFTAAMLVLACGLPVAIARQSAARKDPAPVSQLSG